MAWEHGVSQHPLQRAVTLLALAWPQKSVEEWATVSIGERDRQLLQLREKLFGPKLEATAACPQCGSEMELTFTSRELEVDGRAPESATTEPLKLVSGDYEIDYRLPTTFDLLAVASSSGSGLETLLERCVAARHQGSSVQATALPSALVELVGTKMAEADPYAEIQIALDCGCSHRWSMVFDIVSYLWSEIEDWAERLIRDVHSLASAYGWSEREIVGMSARRRRLYLELANA